MWDFLPNKSDSLNFVVLDEAYYYNPETGDFNEQRLVPRNDSWLNDEDYMNLKIYYIDSEGNRYERRMNKDEARQSYFLED